jgi:RNA polymerase sigma-70 factor, ECF subfamily
VRGATGDPAADRDRQRKVVEAFLAASRRGDFEALLALLDPSVVVRADAAAVESGAAPEVHGAAEAATTFAGRARAARPALVDGLVGLAWAPGGRPRVVFDFTTENGRIVAIDLIADPASLGELELELLDEDG